MPGHYGDSTTKKPATKGKKKAKGKGPAKGSKEMKEKMAKLRAMRGKK